MRAPSSQVALRIDGGDALIEGEFVEASIGISADGVISHEPPPRARRIDAQGLLVLPGIVDIHGDAFERQMMPRPRVHFALDIALRETDRQVIANGITTVFHGVTWSWEPGLRNADNARGILETIERLRPQLTADTRFHLRHETYNFDAEEEITQWLQTRRIDVLAFNDHIAQAIEAVEGSRKRFGMIERSGVSREEYAAVVERARSRAGDVPASVARLAATARECGVPLLSHDDETPEQRRWYHSLGCSIAEFPTNMETAREAAAGGDAIMFGAPNVVRGGSHTGWTSASEMIARGLCSVLASDYYYPAPLIAAFRLAAAGTLSLAQAWALIAEAPAKAVGLYDRGRVAPGCRGDLVLIDAESYDHPSVVATVAGGRLVHLTEAARLLSS